jgi:hypothetical protein
MEAPAGRACGPVHVTIVAVPLDRRAVLGAGAATGFTGTSLLVEPRRRLVPVVLANGHPIWNCPPPRSAP